MRAVSRHSKAIFLVSASFQIVWFRVCVGLLTSSGVVEVYVRVEENIASKVIPNPKRDLVTDIHRSAVLVVVLTVRIRTYPVTKAKICARGLIHLSIDKYVVIDVEINEHQARLRERIRERLDGNGGPAAKRRFVVVAHILMHRAGTRPGIAGWVTGAGKPGL